MAGSIRKLTGRIGGRLRFVRQKIQGIQNFMAARRAVVSGTADWHDLRAWSQRLGNYPWLSGPEQFAAVVMRFDPDLALQPLRDAKIIGGGQGLYNLIAYRCGTLDGVPVFEKVYLRDSPAWGRLDWAYTRILPQLEGRVHTPRLLRRETGRRLAVAYFEFLPDVTPIPEGKVLEVGLSLRRHCLAIDVSDAPAGVTDLRAEPMYTTGVNCLRRVLAAAGRDPGLLDRMERSLLGQASGRKFSHGDIIPANVTAAGVIIDWDRCGAYPAGYELGRIIGHHATCHSLRDFDAVASQGAGELSAALPGSLEFFAALFYARPHGVRVDDALILGLLDRACALRGINAGGAPKAQFRARMAAA